LDFSPTTPPASDRISAIRERLAKATPGPWVNRPRGIVQSQSVKRIIFWDDEPNQGDKTEDIQPSYELIAHAPTDLAYLLSIIDVYAEALGKVNHAVANAWEWQCADPEDSELDRDQQIGNWCEKACDEIREALARVEGMNK